MALYPGSFNGQEVLQPGARGETFQADLPGYRTGEDRINRTNNKLNTSAHDVPNIKYQFDFRLPALFRYGFAYGFNQIVIPKGRIVAVDPYMDLVDFDMRKQHNTVTLANGGVPVKLRTNEVYPTLTGAPSDIVDPGKQGAAVAGAGKEWAPVAGFDALYSAKAFKSTVSDGTTVSGAVKQLTDAGFTVDPNTGRIKDENGNFVNHVRPGNHPIGMLQRNEYTRDDDALNGMMVGPILTDAMVELPWFTFKDKAEQNPWGSAYGNLFPGALVKSDENGRFVVSPLSFEDEVAKMGIAEYEAERQQVVGQIYSVNTELVPEGAAKWATWAIEDRLKFQDFNPAVWPQNNRRGEDAVSNSPYHSSGEYPGYPYDKAYMNNDLHMINGKGARNDVYDQRMNFEYQYENLGIPGLTDGQNVAFRTYNPISAGSINKAPADQDYIDVFFRTVEVDVYDIQLQIGKEAAVPATVGAAIGDTGLKVKYADQKQGIVVLEVADRAAFETFLGAETSVEVKLGFKKRGLAGVPTFLDWDGCVGSIKVLLTK